jgi:ribonuclease J
VSPPVKIVFLGGLGEIGRNCFCLEVDNRILIVDCGIMFPEAEMPGIDLVLPDFTYLRENADRVEAAFLTHAHEDHAGGLAFLLRDISFPVYGSPLSLGLARNRIEEAGMLGRTDLIPVHDGERRMIGPFDCEFIPVTHSVPHAFATAYHTPAGTILHSGDFKLDPRPLDGRTADLERLAEWGRRGVLALLSDSTNVEHDGACGSESDVGPRITELVRASAGRVLVTTFASHLHRIQQVIDASDECGRRIAVAGRGFEDSTRLAGELGYLRFPKGGMVTLEEACRLPAHDVTVLISGSQGEPTSALARLSDGQYKQLAISPGDAVILSSRVIPGNERSVHALLNRLAKRGAVVHSGERAQVHVSGHAYRDELRTMIQLTRPKYFIPVHGEYRQLDEHRRLAGATGMPLDRCFLLEDGDVLELDDKGPRLGERVIAGRVLVDGSGEGEVGLEVLRDRRHLSEDGFVVAVVAIHQQTGEVTSGPELITRGVLGENEGAEVLDDAKSAVLEKLREITPESRADLLEVEDEVRRVLKRYFSRSRGKRPLIVPHIFEM